MRNLNLKFKFKPLNFKVPQSDAETTWIGVVDHGELGSVVSFCLGGSDVENFKFKV